MAERSGRPRSWKQVSWPRLIAQRVRKDVPLAVIDLTIILPAYLIPLVLRHDGAVPPGAWRVFWWAVPFVVVVHLLSNYTYGLYGQMWRYASVLEARRVVLAGVTAMVIIVIGDYTLDALNDARRPIPVSVAMLGATLAFLGFGAVRFQSRLFGLRRRSLPSDRTRVLLVGAGSAAAYVLNDIHSNPSLGLDPIGIVDDDPKKVGLSLRGVPVLGPRSKLPEIVARMDVEQVLMAVPSATSQLVRDVAALCEEADVQLRILPSVHEIVGGRITARDIRDLRIEDLLGRQQVETDDQAVRHLLEGKRVLVTGAGGSIGAEIVRQAIGFDSHPRSSSSTTTRRTCTSSCPSCPRSCP